MACAMVGVLEMTAWLSTWGIADSALACLCLLWLVIIGLILLGIMTDRIRRLG